MMNMLSATTKGLRELESVRGRVAHDFAKRMMTWDDFQFLNGHIDACIERLVEIAANDPDRVRSDEVKAS
jgi:hypothetical protein